MSRHPRSFWVELVAELETGAALAEVARRHRVNASTLRWWRTELRGSARSARLLPVLAEPTAPPPRHVEIAIGVAVLRVVEGTDVEYVGALVRALGSGC